MGLEAPDLIPKPPTCVGCPLYYNGQGFMPFPEGTGSNGVLLVGEALGEQEALVGKPFQGRAGWAFTQTLLRRDLKREDFTIENVLRCRPPENKLNHMSYEGAAIAHCSQYLDATLAARRPKAIVAMGEIPLQRLLGVGKDAKITKWRGYVEWSAKYQAWVIGTFHPAYIMRGNQHLSGVFLHDVEHAVEIAREGYIPHNQIVWEDPPPYVVEGWVKKYEEALARDPEGVWLACDIETPFKQEHEDEGELDADEDKSYTLLRVGYSWQEGEALSIPWQSQYLPLHARLLTSRGVKLWWNGRYDIPRLRHNGIAPGGAQWDLMWGWHVINSDLPMGLEFVAPFLARGQRRWKHLGRTEPARYNGIDAEVTRRIATRLVSDLHTHHLWEVAFERHVVQLDVVLDGMSQVGVPVDQEKRREVSATLQAKLAAAEAEMQLVVPLAAKRLRTYKGKPKGVAWEPGAPLPPGFTLVEGEGVARTCSVCGAPDPKKPHFKVYKRKVNACAAGEVVEQVVTVPRLARIERFVPSNTQMQTYLEEQGHKPRWTRDDKGGKRITFDDMALKELMRLYPKDPLYPRVIDYREYEKLLSTYVGTWDPDTQGWRGGPLVWADGKVHTEFTHAPSTLRLSSRNPNMQNIPRGDEEDSEEKKAIKRLFVPEGGQAFLEVDYKAIEARMVAYFANSPTYDRLARLGVHDYLSSHLLARAGKIARPPDLSWSDGDLKACFRDLKARFPTERNVAKRCVHGGNYGMTPGRMSALYPEYFPKASHAVIVQGIYFEVCPDVRRWQNRTIDQAEETGYLRNPFGYLHRFWQVKSYQKDPRSGKWEGVWGEDAKRVLAFLPQSTAAGLIKEALLDIWYQMGYGHVLRLQVHDSLLTSEVGGSRWDDMVRVVVDTMRKPSPYLPLPWAPGTHLSVDVEAKAGGVGVSWGDLEEIRV